MFTCGLRKGISILDCAWRWILHWALPPCTSPVNHWGEEHYSFFLKRFFWANECVFVNNTLINWGFASRTVATKHTWSSNAGCKDLCITPASPFLVILGTAKYRAESHKERTVNTANSTFWWNLTLNVIDLTIVCLAKRSFERRTVVEGFEVANEFHIFIDRRSFGVDGPSQHMAAELHVIFSWRTKKKTYVNF